MKQGFLIIRPTHGLVETIEQIYVEKIKYIIIKKNVNIELLFNYLPPIVKMI